MRSTNSSKLPIQAAPVERNVTGAAISNQQGVEASFDLGSLINTIGSLI